MKGAEPFLKLFSGEKYIFKVTRKKIRSTSIDVVLIALFFTLNL